MIKLNTGASKLENLLLIDINPPEVGLLKHVKTKRLLPYSAPPLLMFTAGKTLLFFLRFTSLLIGLKIAAPVRKGSAANVLLQFLQQYFSKWLTNWLAE